VDNAKEQMDLMLRFWLKREHLSSSNMNFDWIVSRPSYEMILLLIDNSLPHMESHAAEYSASSFLSKSGMRAAFGSHDQKSSGNSPCLLVSLNGPVLLMETLSSSGG
jgi:hypothetical protein